MKQIIFIFAMLMTCLSYAVKPEGRSERLSLIHILGELEQTYHLEKIVRTDRRSCDMRNEICMYKFRAIDIHNP